MCLLNKLNSTVDGEFQRLGVSPGSEIRESFFGPDPRLRKLVADMTDEELEHLPRGGHDYKKLYSAYKAATDQQGRSNGRFLLRRSRAGRSAPTSKGATPRTRSRRCPTNSFENCAFASN